MDDLIAMEGFGSNAPDPYAANDFKRPDKKISIAERFAALHAQSKKLNVGHVTDDAIPTLNLQPTQLYESSVRLRNKVNERIGASGAAADTDANGIKAFKYLAQRGYDPAKLKKNLANVEVPTNFEPYEPLGDTDVEGYLKHHYHVVVLTAAEEARRSTIRESSRNFEMVLDKDWESAKALLKQNFGTRYGRPRGSPATGLEGATPVRRIDDRKREESHGDTSFSFVSTPRQSLDFQKYAGSPAYGSDGSTVLGKRPLEMDSKIAANRRGFRGSTGASASSNDFGGLPARADTYAQVIRRYNSTRASGGSRSPIAVASLLLNTLKSSGFAVEDTLTSWQAIRRILGEDQFQTDQLGRFIGNGGIGEQHYKALIRTVPIGRGNESVARGIIVQKYKARLKLLRGSLRALTWQFSLHVKDRVMGNRDPSYVKSTGGVPSTLADVVRYVQSLRLGDSAVDGIGGPTKPHHLFWPILFYLLRCGGPAEDIRSLFVDAKLAAYRTVVETEAQTLADGIMSTLMNICLHFVHRSTSYGDVPYGDAAATLGAAKKIRERWRARDDGHVFGGFRDAVLNLVSYDDPTQPLPNRGDGNNSWTMEDFLWQKLSFVLKPIEGGSWANVASNDLSEFSLQRWVNVVIKSKKQFVARGKSPYIYFRALLYCLEFERAISFLASAAPNAARASDTAAWFADAVHMAIAFHHYGALRTVTTSQQVDGRGSSSSAFLAMLLQDSRSSVEGVTQPHLRLDLLVRRQLRPFVLMRGDPRTAFEYLFALWQKPIGVSTSEDQIPGLLLSLMVEVLLSSGVGQFRDLLDYLTRGGQIRLTIPQCTRLTNEAARHAMDCGLVKEAICLWSLDRVGKYSMAVRVLNEQLSLHLMSTNRSSTSSTPGDTVNSEIGAFAQERKDLITLAGDFFSRSQNSEVMKRGLSRATAKIDLDALCIFISLYQYVDLCGKPSTYDKALLKIQSDPLRTFIPSRNRDLEDAVNRFSRASQFLKHKMPQLLLMHMKCLRWMHTQSRRGSAKCAESSEQLRARAALLVKFASMIESDGFSIPDSIYSWLSAAHMAME